MIYFLFIVSRENKTNRLTNKTEGFLIFPTFFKLFMLDAGGGGISLKFYKNKIGNLSRVENYFS